MRSRSVLVRYCDTLPREKEEPRPRDDEEGFVWYGGTLSTSIAFASGDSGDQRRQPVPSRVDQRQAVPLTCTHLLMAMALKPYSSRHNQAALELQLTYSSSRLRASASSRRRHSTGPHRARRRTARSRTRTCKQRPSAAVSGRQRPSAAISGRQRPSAAVSGHQRPATGHSS